MIAATYTQGKRGAPKINLPCGIVDCDRQIRTNGLCAYHYWRARKDGLNREQMLERSGIQFPAKEDKAKVTSKDIPLEIELEHGEHTPYIRVMANILIQAVRDWENYGKYRSIVEMRAAGVHKSVVHNCMSAGYTDPRQELLDFFHSAWCADLMITLGYEWPEHLEKISVPLP